MTNKQKAINKIKAIVLHVKETHDEYDELVDKLEALETFINKNL